MGVTSIHDRAEIARLLRKDVALHAYELGDLDDFFWPFTTWYRLGDGVALIYHGAGFPTLLALGTPDTVRPLLEEVTFLLPQRFYAHVSAGADEVLTRKFEVEHGGLHMKMALTDPDALASCRPEGDVLTGADLIDLTALYRVAYPENWFDPRMLETGQYVGVRREGELVAVAGIHVWSPVYRIAALGNVTTHPRVRGQGLGKSVVAALCRRLAETVDVITLNVKADNASAIAVYARLGFTPVGEYHEFWAAARSGQAR